ncbi:rhomboid family intramembrane serine protease [Thermogemmatispora sp.]|uniref:rhomboid family intramembrane serine protease n=1 Tax=Thermogemmatispora sp. TaxID=1968838 RepID=UPI0035E41519
MIPFQDFPGPRRHLPWVTWGLILINVLVFLYELSLGSRADELIFAYGVVPVALVHGLPQTALVQTHLAFQTPEPVYFTLITSQFLHAGWLHIGGNMLFLYVFGDNVEDRLGHFPYLCFYLLCGIVAGVAQAVAFPDSTIPSIGASGAIAGVLAAYLVLFPLAGVRTVIFIFFFFTIVTLPAIVLIGLWFLLQLFDGVASLAQVQQGMGGVAYLAHVGGFLTGLIITLLLRPWLKPPAPISYPSYPYHPYSRENDYRRWW